MSMTTGDELGKSDVFVKLAVTLFPLAEEAMRQGMTMKEFESGLFGELLCTGKRVLDQFLIAQGDGDLGETTIHPDESNDDRISEPQSFTAVRKRRPECCERSLANMNFPPGFIAKARIADVRSC